MPPTICKKWVLALIAALPLLLAIPRPATAQSAKADDGQKVFEQNCATCHGPDGSANTAIGKSIGAKDLRSAEAQKMTDAKIHTQIEKGKGNMPPFGGTLNKAQIDNLIPYVRGLSNKEKSKDGKKSN